MNKTLIISEKLFHRLQHEAHVRGLENVEQLLEAWAQEQSGSLQRQEHVQKIDQLREHLMTKYGQMSDSTLLVREDRSR